MLQQWRRPCRLIQVLARRRDRGHGLEWDGPWRCARCDFQGSKLPKHRREGLSRLRRRVLLAPPTGRSPPTSGAGAATAYRQAHCASVTWPFWARLRRRPRRWGSERAHAGRLARQRERARPPVLPPDGPRCSAPPRHMRRSAHLALPAKVCGLRRRPSQGIGEDRSARSPACGSAGARYAADPRCAVAPHAVGALCPLGHLGHGAQHAAGGGQRCTCAARRRKQTASSWECVTQR